MPHYNFDVRDGIIYPLTKRVRATEHRMRPGRARAILGGNGPRCSWVNPRFLWGNGNAVQLNRAPEV
ncbi:hypothetical protein V1290_001615 [Bradyrhizobium sp. AZCC 1578]